MTSHSRPYAFRAMRVVGCWVGVWMAALGVQLAAAASLTWNGGTSTWGDGTAVGWNGPAPVPGDIACVYSGTATCDHKDQVKGLFLIIGTNGTVACNEMNYMGQPALLTFSGGGALALVRNAHYNNYGALLLPATVWVTGRHWQPALIEARGATEHNFINLPATATLQVYDLTGDAKPDLRIAAPLADGADLGQGTTWVPASLVKDGPGTLELAAANAYSGTTTVRAGALLVRGSLGAGGVTVASGATLCGDGTIGGEVVSDGIVGPGDGAGRLSIQKRYTQNAGGTLEVDILGTTPASGYDVLAASGAVALGGTLTVRTRGYAPVAGDRFTILTGAEVTGAFAATNLPVLAPGLSWEVKLTPTAVTLLVSAATAGQ
jgi:autotransporter-associated beta strand protein